MFDAPGGTWGGAMAVVGVLAYSVQQYCDFSGGIDLVAGIAELFGIRLAENFRRPYFAVSLGDFWRRWHISLGAWMRDYVFYPFALCRPVARLSKAAKGRFGAAFARALPAALGNILVFTLVGVWHGATSNYILWGLYNGVILALTALLEPRVKRMNERCPRLTGSRGFHVFRVLRTFIIVNIGWFFDRCATAGDAVRMMGSILTTPCLEQVSLVNLGLSPLGRADFGGGRSAVVHRFAFGRERQGCSRLARRARSADPLGGDDRRGSRHSAYRRLGKRFQRSELYLFQFLGRGRLGTLPQTLPET